MESVRPQRRLPRLFRRRCGQLSLGGSEKRSAPALLFLLHATGTACLTFNRLAGARYFTGRLWLVTTMTPPSRATTTATLCICGTSGKQDDTKQCGTKRNSRSPDHCRLPKVGTTTFCIMGQSFGSKHPPEIGMTVRRESPPSHRLGGPALPTPRRRAGLLIRGRRLSEVFIGFVRETGQRCFDFIFVQLGCRLACLHRVKHLGHLRHQHVEKSWHIYACRNCRDGR